LNPEDFRGDAIWWTFPAERRECIAIAVEGRFVKDAL
jgi:hypothetical protein